MRSQIGNALKIALEGGSHGEYIIGEADGLPKGIYINKEELTAFMKRRQGGQSPFTTPRAETDIPTFNSGIDHLPNGDMITNGERLIFTIANNNKRSGDYAQFSDTPRPSHADYTAKMRYGDQIDLRGGGHFSARLTAPLCVIGGICLQWLNTYGISVGAHLYSVGHTQDIGFDAVNCSKNHLIDAQKAEQLPVLSPEAANKMIAELTAVREAGDSLGGTVECAAIGVPAGLGDPLFFGMENRISQLVFGLGGVRGIEFGTGIKASSMRGSEHNDPFVTDGKIIRTLTNHCGGIQAGITNGMPILFRVAFKPTASISIEQKTVSLSGMTNEILTINGRHDPCIAIRAVPCVEAVTAIALADAILEAGR